MNKAALAWLFQLVGPKANAVVEVSLATAALSSTRGKLCSWDENVGIVLFRRRF